MSGWANFKKRDSVKGVKPLRALSGLAALIYVYHITWCVFQWTYVSNHKELLGDNWRLYEFFGYEAYVFFSWLAASASFLLFIYLTKFNAVWNDFKGSNCDKFIWRNKHTQDSLNYFQWENELWSLNA